MDFLLARSYQVLRKRSETGKKDELDTDLKGLEEHQSQSGLEEGEDTDVSEDVG